MFLRNGPKCKLNQSLEHEMDQGDPTVVELYFTTQEHYGGAISLIFCIL